MLTILSKRFTELAAIEPDVDHILQRGVCPGCQRQASTPGNRAR